MANGNGNDNMWTSPIAIGCYSAAGGLTVGGIGGWFFGGRTAKKKWAEAEELAKKDGNMLLSAAVAQINAKKAKKDEEKKPEAAKVETKVETKPETTAEEKKVVNG